ncbi:MAG TPA: CoA ester lyase [Solirubrobacteraceae bacterium]|jgi:citrate lyase subunit beta/citryl-CoA lyase
MSSPTPNPARRLRSALYMPGANERALVKAHDIPADALILDLEDAVAPSAKGDARARVCAAAASGAYGSRTVTIRVNGIATEWHRDDVTAAARAGPHAVVVPKVGEAADVHGVEKLLVKAGAPDHTRIWAMLETPAAILRAAEIAASSERLEVLVMGTNDLAAELYADVARAEPPRGPLLAALSACVLAARASGRTILDGVYNHVRDPDGFAAECRQGRSYGFDGKTLIHPSQVEPCNQAFSPSPEEVEHAHRVIEAFEEAERAGSGVVTVDGRMIENLHVATARRVLALAA